MFNTLLVLHYKLFASCFRKKTLSMRSMRVVKVFGTVEYACGSHFKKTPFSVNTIGKV